MRVVSAEDDDLLREGSLRPGLDPRVKWKETRISRNSQRSLAHHLGGK